MEHLEEDEMKMTCGYRYEDVISCGSDSEIAEPSSKKSKPNHWPGILSFGFNFVSVKLFIR